MKYMTFRHVLIASALLATTAFIMPAKAEDVIVLKTIQQDALSETSAGPVSGYAATTSRSA
ncbi:hypothetical protein [Paracoccus sp. JM45]|uniref:hypothetical protein n=1 Tax=Paracoccus sp. JM45 TaxID=2283626 RepID=UPI000E6CD24E|nr:hypothetical protein [Paracoccus sp. JM45]RJE78695.1 hypothetical protein DWB67_16320 [Paracoccus sp. JM45]